MRKTVENPYGELIFPICILGKLSNLRFENIPYVAKELIDSGKLVCNNYLEYIKDFESYPECIRKDYITKCSIEMNEFDIWDKIEKVFICGKSVKNYPEIEKLVKNLPKSQATKADIFIRLNDGSYIGVSIKNQKDATKMNRSVHAVLGGNNAKTLTNIKKSLIHEKLGIENVKDKSKRDQINKLFQSQNRYWDSLKEKIEENKKIVINDLYNTLYGVNIKFPLYEFDGDTLKKIEPCNNIDDVIFKEHKEFYYTKNGNLRSAAKLFYIFETSNEKYRVEIRHKGDFSASPQFQFHKIQK